MVRVKIISNPYKKEIKYQREENSKWIDINNRNSGLLSAEFTEGFFPFKAKQIVSQIIKDFQIDGEAIELWFEGSSDEFDELVSVCKDKDFAVSVKPVCAENYLENARDILPNVKSLFQKMTPFISHSADSEEIKRYFQRFSDASDDVVPICVMGNYSSGKSTFINALIGCEILPNGSNPVTAKVYKITRAKYADRASIKFRYATDQIVLMMTAQETHFEALENQNALTNKLTEEVLSLSNESIPKRMNKAIRIINDYEEDLDDNVLSDLIEIEIPFVNGVLANSQHPFVIFDTPGSNSASKVKHLEVLKMAMENMTNGLPIFVATPDSLDSTDNASLYKMMEELKELDRRFTMVIVNKADQNDLNRNGSSLEEEQQVLHQAVPRNLYSAGIFYVSSILGLGAKNNGEFYDDSYSETFEDQERKFTEPENRRYKQLYRYNIMPWQMKKNSDYASADEKNLLYANSGIFSVETEIEAFAGKYSAYNKCYQSKQFLEKIIQLTGTAIENNKSDIKKTSETLQKILVEKKQRLIEQLEKDSEKKQSEYKENYTEYMRPYLLDASKTFSLKCLKKIDEERREQLANEQQQVEQVEQIEEISRDSDKKRYSQHVGSNQIH